MIALMVGNAARARDFLDDIYNVGFLAPCDLEPNDIIEGRIGESWGDFVPIAIIRDGKLIWGESETGGDVPLMNMVYRHQTKEEYEECEHAAAAYGMA